MIPRLTKHDLADVRKLEQAAKAGIFYYKIPDYVSAHAHVGYKFGQNIEEIGPRFNRMTSNIQTEINKQQHILENFSQRTNIPISTEGEHCGFHSRDEDQVTSFYLERCYWGYFDPDLFSLLSEINRDNQDILKATLKYLDINERDWDLMTKCKSYSVFNNYNPENNKINRSNSHKNFGLVNMLISNKPGLEIKIGDGWHPVEHDPDYFIVNYGGDFSLLDTHKEINVVDHRVVSQKEPRVSFGVSSGGHLKTPTTSHQSYIYEQQYKQQYSQKL